MLGGRLPYSKLECSGIPLPMPRNAATRAGDTAANAVFVLSPAVMDVCI